MGYVAIMKNISIKKYNQIMIQNLLKVIIFLTGLTLTIGCRQNKETPTQDGVTNETYTEQHRLQFHFSPQEKWMNDPNGMVYYKDEYHLFYQYYPDSTVWGPMHWGHAVSKDLVRWEHLPIALYPDSLGFIFSGSAVVDRNNTTGFGTAGNPPLVAMYTYHDMEGEKSGRHDFQTQGIAYSLDKGRTWEKYENNPVIPNLENIHDFRDPKVFWHEETQNWVMILAANDKVKIYNSKDLKTWEHTSDFGLGHGSQARPWECPDLFKMTTQDGEEKWVMLVSIGNRIEIQAPNGGTGTQYFVGDFDGKTFNNVQAKERTTWIDYGRDNYAGVTWSNIPKEDGRIVFIGWMSNWDYAQVVPTVNWRSAMTLPRSLLLKKNDAHYLLCSTPVKELETLRNKSVKIEKTTVQNELDLSEKVNATQCELVLEFNKSSTATNFGIQLSNTRGDVYQIGYDVENKNYYSDRRNSRKNNFSEDFAPKIHMAPHNLTKETIKMHLFFDASSVELFADDGATVITDIFFPTEDFTIIKVFTEDGGEVEVMGSAYNLKGIWK